MPVVTLPKLNPQTSIIMAYAFKVTAKQNIGGSKGIAKGMSVQISKEGSNPNVNDILAAFNRQLGIEIKGISVSTSYFNIEKLK